jgi:hypothetical protein
VIVFGGGCHGFWWDSIVDNRRILLYRCVVPDRELYRIAARSQSRRGGLHPPSHQLRLSIDADWHHVEGRMQSAPTDYGYIHYEESPK